MNYKELADRARYFKKDKEGQEIMSKIMEDCKAMGKDSVTLLGEFFQKIKRSTCFLCYNVITNKTYT